MFIEEIIPEKNIKYIISSEKLNKKYISLSKMGNIYIYNVIPDIKINYLKTDHNIKKIFDTISCKCGYKLKGMPLSRLPSYGWQEMVGMWSCHNNEFKTVFQLKLKKTKKVLFSDFYYFHDCSENKIFYNEVTSDFSTQKIIFCFFDFYFNNNNIFEYKNLKINFLCDVVLKMENKLFIAKKVMYKYCKNYLSDENDDHINYFFFDKLLKELECNHIKTDIFETNISYIMSLCSGDN
ncbi:hypothetical protein DMUE_4125 [Dictyocoela muelleri]|nr:hypothetical protein DMUE_4125 [Dictyocoela muelleri]